jgi:hypothetical protein
MDVWSIKMGRPIKSMNLLMRRNCRIARHAAGAACFSSALLLLWVVPAKAHNGPPFPIITDQHVGPCIVSLWIHPDIGTSPIFILVDAPPGAALPKDLKIQIGVQPVSNRLAEVIYPTTIEDQRGQLEYKTNVDFDQQEFWKVRLILSSSNGGGEAVAQVEATPYGYGRWDLLLFALPFLAVAFLFFNGVAKRRRLRKLRMQQAA